MILLAGFAVVITVVYVAAFLRGWRLGARAEHDRMVAQLQLDPPLDPELLAPHPKGNEW